MTSLYTKSAIAFHAQSIFICQLMIFVVPWTAATDGVGLANVANDPLHLCLMLAALRGTTHIFDLLVCCDPTKSIIGNRIKTQDLTPNAYAKAVTRAFESGIISSPGCSKVVVLV